MQWNYPWNCDGKYNINCGDENNDNDDEDNDDNNNNKDNNCSF